MDPPAFTITAFGLTDQGLVRSRNEDALLVNEQASLFAVADGLGGLPEGALASRMAVDGLSAGFSRLSQNGQFDFGSLFLSVNQSVYTEGLVHNPELGIGTTLTAMTISDRDALFGHVGDSSAFLIRSHEIRKLTRDHTMEEEIRTQFPPGDTRPIPEVFSHTLTRCIGQKEDLEIDQFTTRLEAGDRLLICSDGAGKVVEEERLEAMVNESPTAEQACHAVVEEALDQGGPDNISVVAIYID